LKEVKDAMDLRKAGAPWQLIGLGNIEINRG